MVTFLTFDTSLADEGHSTQLDLADLGGGRQDRVWYAEVLMLFSVTIKGGTATEQKINMAWVQWYERFGAPSEKDPRQHVDPDFPAVLDEYFPRLFLPEYELGAAYEEELVQSIIAPAPLCKDLSIMHYSPQDEANARVFPIFFEVNVSFLLTFLLLGQATQGETCLDPGTKRALEGNRQGIT